MSRYFDNDPEPVHTFFGLSYASYYVINRTVLQSMPIDWQRKWCALAEQVREEFPHLPWPDYNVRVLARPARLIPDTVECEECHGDGEVEHPVDFMIYECPACDGLGEIATDMRYEEAEEVGFIADPIPPYSRGRTRLQPDFGSKSDDG